MKKFGLRLRMAWYRSPWRAFELMISSRVRTFRSGGGIPWPAPPEPVHAPTVARPRRAIPRMRINEAIGAARPGRRESGRPSPYRLAGTAWAAKTRLGGPLHTQHTPHSLRSAVDQHPKDTVHVRCGRRSHMNDPPGVVKFAALLPATERGNTMSVTAEPGTVVPGVTSQSRPTVQPAV